MKWFDLLSSFSTMALGLGLIVNGVFSTVAGQENAWALLLGGVVIGHTGYRVCASDLCKLWSVNRVETD